MAALVMLGLVTLSGVGWYTLYWPSLRRPKGRHR